MRRGGRLVAGGAGAVCLLLAATVPATAATVSAYPGYHDSRESVPPRMLIQGGAQRDRLKVGYRDSSGAFRIRDNHRLKIRYVSDAQTCTRVHPNEVLCTSDPVKTRLDVFGRGGSDRIRVGRTVPVDSYIGGGRGADVLMGGWHRDRIEGGHGPDVERGRRGPDDLGTIGDPGHDDFRAGRGKDTIYAIDKQHDHKIGCGRGAGDYASFDAHVDPKPVGCEQSAGY